MPEKCLKKMPEFQAKCLKKTKMAKIPQLLEEIGKQSWDCRIYFSENFRPGYIFTLAATYIFEVQVQYAIASFIFFF